MELETSLETTEETMECPFSDVGCSEKLTSKTYEAHLSQNTELHLDLVQKLQSPTLPNPEMATPTTDNTHNSSLNHYSVPNSIGKESNCSSQEAEYDLREKLSSMEREANYLDRTLNSLGLDYIPALEVIKSILRGPRYSINRFGECCTFRLQDFTSLKRSGRTWSSPVFTLNHQYQMKIEVSMNKQTTQHLSVSLLLVGIRGKPNASLCEEAKVIKLPEHIGVRVDLLLEADSCDDDDSDSLKDSEAPSLLMTWKPKVESPQKSSSLSDGYINDSGEENNIIEAPSILKKISVTSVKSSASKNDACGNKRNDVDIQLACNEAEDGFKAFEPNELERNSDESVSSLPNHLEMDNLTNGTSAVLENTSEVANTLNGDVGDLKNQSNHELGDLVKQTNDDSINTSTPVHEAHYSTQQPTPTRTKNTDSNSYSPWKGDVSTLDNGGCSRAEGQNGQDGGSVIEQVVVLCSEEKFATLCDIENTVEEYDSLVLQVTMSLM